MDNNFGRQVICMVKADGSKDAFVVVANEGLTVEDIVQRLLTVRRICYLTKVDF